MTFAEALEQMKKGAKAKRPTWHGYWEWDPEKETVQMHCRDGNVLEIRDTERVEYTLLNVAATDWIVADENNCPEMGGEALFGFGEAIGYIKRGLKLTRKGWNGKGMYVFLADDVEFHTAADIGELEGLFEVGEMLVMRTAQGTLQPGWLATQADMLAEDWMFV